jgi:hypothetical protein
MLAASTMTSSRLASTRSWPPSAAAARGLGEVAGGEDDGIAPQG